MNVTELFQLLWQDYEANNPIVKKVYTLLANKNDKVINDHIALRTFNHPKVNVEQLGKIFLALGYEEKGSYHFEEKKLNAKHYEHKQDPSHPKVFISELLLENFSESLQKTINDLIEKVDVAKVKNPDFLCCHAPWGKISYQQYIDLIKESEYAAWLAVFGYRANHFTVYINALSSFENIEDLNDYLIENGIELNAAGGLIKGSKEQLLEQSSTLANRIRLEFSDGTHEIASCYYEFAKRYQDATGKLYTGFIEKSADKIFESTDTKK